jgi:uncharacterized alkaline shock family protein YloU
VATSTVGSERVELARIAAEAAAAVPGVAAPARDRLRRWETSDRDTALEGVVCLPVVGGGYVVELHLVAELVPLPALAEAIRDSIERRVSTTALGRTLRRVDVTFEDVVVEEVSGTAQAT